MNPPRSLAKLDDPTRTGVVPPRVATRRRARPAREPISAATWQSDAEWSRRTVVRCHPDGARDGVNAERAGGRRAISERCGALIGLDPPLPLQIRSLYHL